MCLYHQKNATPVPIEVPLGSTWISTLRTKTQQLFTGSSTVFLPDVDDPSTTLGLETSITFTFSTGYDEAYLRDDEEWRYYGVRIAKALHSRGNEERGTRERSLNTRISIRSQRASDPHNHTQRIRFVARSVRAHSVSADRTDAELRRPSGSLTGVKMD